jgi:HAD superfamily 5'-nucleotidase-like hydrolase
MPESPAGLPPQERRIFCNRTLNFRSIGAVGYDMDYTLVHYRVEDWERRAYERLRERLQDRGWPVAELRFDPTLVIQGLIVDTQLGNVVKADRFGFIKRACHGGRMLDFEERRAVYAQTRADLSEPRWVFLNTLFSLSEGCFYLQLVDLLDQRRLPEVLGYAELYHLVKSSLDATHTEGELKADILAAPERFVELDPLLPLTLLDQRHAGKKLLLITNSEWPYVKALMAFAFDRFLPAGTTWRDLFDAIIVSARKPEFFASHNPLFEVTTDDGLLRPAPRGLRDRGVFFGGNASQVEDYLGLSGGEILYVGDHIYGDVHVTKSLLRWRTALILRDLESELGALSAFAPHDREIAELMEEKEALELRQTQARLQLQRRQNGYGPPAERSPSALEAELVSLRARVLALDERIGPLARKGAELVSSRWGPLMRTGNDKSRLARQVESYADVYTSRVSNFLAYTPYLFLRAPRGSLPHDPHS